MANFLDSVDWDTELKNRDVLGTLTKLMSQSDMLIVVQTWTADLVAIVRQLYPSVIYRIADGRLQLRIVVAAVCHAVLNWAQNPENFKMESDGTYQYQLNTNAQDPTSYFTAADAAMLAGTSRRVGTINVGLQCGWR